MYMDTCIYTSTYILEYTHSHINTYMYACTDVGREQEKEEQIKEWMTGKKGGRERERRREGERREASRQRGHRSELF
jgi:hypothetical protein